MAIPPSLGTGWPWIFRDESAWSRRPLRWASLLTSGVRIVPQTIDKMKATAAVLIARGAPSGGGRAGQDPVSEREHVHLRLEVAVERLGRRRHDGLVLVEAGVE